MKTLLFLIILTTAFIAHARDYGDYDDRPYVDKYSTKYYDKHDAPYDKYSPGYDGLPFVNTEKSGLLMRDEQGRVTDIPYTSPSPVKSK